jgi:hypothetical protein
LSGAEYLVDLKKHDQAVAVHLAPPRFQLRDEIDHLLLVRVRLAQEFVELLLEWTEDLPPAALRFEKAVEDRADPF